MSFTPTLRTRIAGWIIRNIKPDNVHTRHWSNTYEIRERDKFFNIPYGYFWHAVAVGYLLKVIKFITKRTKE